MDYRAPVEGLERRLGDLEEELARLRALPAIARKGPPAKSKAERALERRLARLEEALASAGYRELTARESSSVERTARLGVVIVVLGLGTASFHLVERARVAMTWRETTCAIVAEEEDMHVARYVSQGREWKFSAPGESRSVAECWVPYPPVSGVGRLVRPSASSVSLWERLSLAWLVAAACAVSLGAGCLVAAWDDARKRRRGAIAPDDFGSSSD
jgi:hypothetical protein